jgi:hypothetical protein
MDARLYEAVKKTYEDGYFVVSDSFEHGCYGIHCEAEFGPDGIGFFCFGMDAETFEGSVEDYVAYVGIKGICSDITDVLADPIANGLSLDEAIVILDGMKDVCGKEYESLLDGYIGKAIKDNDHYMDYLMNDSFFRDDEDAIEYE